MNTVSVLFGSETANSEGVVWSMDYQHPQWSRIKTLVAAIRADESPSVVPGDMPLIRGYLRRGAPGARWDPVMPGSMILEAKAALAAGIDHAEWYWQDIATAERFLAKMAGREWSLSEWRRFLEYGE